MNIIEIKKELAKIRNYCKSNYITVVGDGDGIKIDTRKVEFSATTLTANFTIDLGSVNVSYVTRASSAGVIGFTNDNKTVNLNDCISFNSMYDGNHRCNVTTGIPLMDIPEALNCKFILIAEYDRFDDGAETYKFTLYIAPNLKAAIEAEEEEDEIRWNKAYQQSTKNYHTPGKNNRGGGGK